LPDKAKTIDVESFLGKKFAWGGRGPDEYDCWGLCYEISRQLGNPFPEHQSFKELELRTLAIAEGVREFRKIDKPQPWCGVVFKAYGKYVNHMGIVLEDCRHFIHIREASEVSIEKLNHPIWQRMLDGFYVYENQAD